MLKPRIKLPGASIIVPVRKELGHLLEGFSQKIPFLRTMVKLIADVVESAEKVTVNVEIPGIDPKDVDVSIKGNSLTIKGRKRAERAEKGKQYHMAERTYGEFERTIDIPPFVEMEKAEAEYNNGILKITIPKTENAKTKQIPVA